MAPPPPSDPPRAASAQAVQSALAAAGVRCQVVELPASTRTAKEAAAAIGCEVAQIAKSIVLRGLETDTPYLVVASGVNRIDEKAVASEVGEPVEMAAAGFVLQATGYAIGGVPPVGHRQAITTLLDRDLLALDSLWAAAGTPHAVFRLTPAELRKLVGDRVVAIRRQGAVHPFDESS